MTQLDDSAADDVVATFPFHGVILTWYCYQGSVGETNLLSCLVSSCKADDYSFAQAELDQRGLELSAIRKRALEAKVI